MIKVTGTDRAAARLRGVRQRFEAVSTPEGVATRLTEKHAHLVCPEHGGRPTYAVKPQSAEVSGAYCCEKLRDMAKEAGFNPL